MFGTIIIPISQHMMGLLRRLLLLQLLQSTFCWMLPKIHESSPRKLARRQVVAAGVGVLALPVQPQSAASSMSSEELDALDLWSRTAEGVTLPSGVRVIEMGVGDGPLPVKGQHIWSHFKVWTGGFRSGTPADSSFRQCRPYDWILGSPTDRMPAGFDEGAQGMREGGWRRLVVPSSLAYGSAGLRLPGARALIVPPDTPVYVDLRMMDGGSGRCDAILRPPGTSEAGAKNLKSISCVRGVP